jgi:hypothetical protein
MEDGRRKMEDGRWKMEEGRCKKEDVGRRIWHKGKAAHGFSPCAAIPFLLYQ